MDFLSILQHRNQHLLPWYSVSIFEQNKKNLPPNHHLPPNQVSYLGAARLPGYFFAPFSWLASWCKTNHKPAMHRASELFNYDTVWHLNIVKRCRGPCHHPPIHPARKIALQFWASMRIPQTGCCCCAHEATSALNPSQNPFKVDWQDLVFQEKQSCGASIVSDACLGS